MQSVARIRPTNSLIFISDVSGGKTPDWRPGKLVLANSTCISVRCYPEQDGPTDIVLGSGREVDPGEPPAFDGELETPNRAVVVSTVDQEQILEAQVSTTRTRARIWLNDSRWPDKVVVGLE